MTRHPSPHGDDESEQGRLSQAQDEMQKDDDQFPSQASDATSVSFQAEWRPAPWTTRDDRFAVSFQAEWHPTPWVYSQ